MAGTPRASAPKRERACTIFCNGFFLFLQYYVLVTLSFFGNTIEENLRPSFLGGVNDAGVGET